MVLGLIKFFGHLCRQHPKEMHERFASFAAMVLNECSSRDLTLRVICIETLAYIGSTSEGKRALLKFGKAA